MKQLIPLFITFFLISCGGAKTEKTQPAPNNNQSAIRIDDSVDSMCVDRMLKVAIDTAYTAMNTDRFKKEFVTMCDSFYNVDVNMAMDHFFSPNEKHLIIHLHIPGEDRFNIYLVQDKAFIKIASHSQVGPGGTTDTLQDVNGDGAKDYLINWYGANGCCLKNFYAVYLYQPQSSTFSNGYEFINPTFSAEEKVVRGVDYGHPGETSMYKYKWNGLQVDTLEEIYFEKDDNGKKTGKVIRKTTKEERLKQVPAEYKHIYGYDWFTGKF
jgi:hypothetical protein